MEEAHSKVLKDAFISITKLRHDVGEDSFRKILLSLSAGARNIKHASELARNFDEDNGKFIRPYLQVLKIIGNNPLKRIKFRRCILNFKPRKKGGRGGLKQYAKELRQERDMLAKILKEYNELASKKKPSLSEQEKLSRLSVMTPKVIRDLILNKIDNKQGRIRPAYKEIAIRWMIRYYPCTKNTLIQIIREASID